MTDTPPLHRRWPNAQLFVVENRRILFQPVAKNGCTSLKTLMVDLSDIPDKAAVRERVHEATDSARTGLHLKDRSAEEVARILAAPDYFRFGVVRDPFDRLVSAYVEKFVVKRGAAYQHYATGPVVAAVQGRAEADHAAGITFRQFVEHVIGVPPERLDPHWRPQIDYFRDVALDRLYGLGDFDLLQRDLSLHCGEPVRIDHRNRSRGQTRLVAEGVADMPPAALERIAMRLTSESFFDADLGLRVGCYFAADLTLYRAAAAACAARRRALRAEAALGPAAPAAEPAGLLRLDPDRLATLRKALSLNGLRRGLGLAPLPRRR